jgi:hypothetical protein
MAYLDYFHTHSTFDLPPSVTHMHHVNLRSELGGWWTLLSKYVTLAHKKFLRDTMFGPTSRILEGKLKINK